MKKIFTKQLMIALPMLFIGSMLYAQSYFISFSGSGQSTTVETVEVKNLTQGTSLILSGSDTLHLGHTLGIHDPISEDPNMLVYPNPANNLFRIEFNNGISGNVTVEIFDFSGKLMASKSATHQQGKHTYHVKGLRSGIYMIKINTPEGIFSQKVISTAEYAEDVTIRYEGRTPVAETGKQPKNLAEIIFMQYNEGERLMLKGISGDYARIITMVPTESQTVDFEFVDCIDGDGNHYAVVSIGEQTWMAYNLRTKTLSTGVTIPGPFAGDEWVANSTNGQNPAYAIYDHEHSGAVGLESPEEVVEAYGKMYNWYAVETGNLCPDGWSVPDTTAWNQLIDYVIDTYPEFNEDNVAMAVKSCRQINSPIGGDCATDIHPRWREDEDHYGDNTTGLGLIAAGYILSSNGNSSWMAARGYWWTASAHGSDPNLAIFRRFNHTDSQVSKGSFNKGVGQPIRCIKD